MKEAIQPVCALHSDPFRDQTWGTLLVVRPGWWGLRVCCSGMHYSGIITMEPGKRTGKPCIRGLRMTVADVLGYLAAGMTHEELLGDFPYLTEEVFVPV